MHTWRLEDNLWEPVIFNSVGSGDQTQVFPLGSKCLYQLSYFEVPLFLHFFPRPHAWLNVCLCAQEKARGDIRCSTPSFSALFPSEGSLTKPGSRLLTSNLQNTHPILHLLAPISGVTEIFECRSSNLHNKYPYLLSHLPSPGTLILCSLWAFQINFQF